MKRIRWMIWVIIAAMVFGNVPIFATSQSTSLCSYPSEIGTDSAYTEKYQNPLYGRSILFFGDSLCNARGESLGGYAGRIGRKYSMNWKKYGASGYSLTRGIPTSGTIRSELQKASWDNKNLTDPVEYDLIVLQGGVNDAWRDAPLGTISAGFDRLKFDDKTFAGALETLLYYAREYFPDATICYLIMYQMPLGQWKNDSGVYEPVPGVQDQSQYVALQKQILEKWGIPYLDFYNDAEFNETIFSVNSPSSPYLAEDHIHMSSTGYSRISLHIAAWLETLPLPVRAGGVDSESETEAETETQTETEIETESEIITETETETDTEIESESETEIETETEATIETETETDAVLNVESNTDDGIEDETEVESEAEDGDSAPQSDQKGSGNRKLLFPAICAGLLIGSAGIGFVLWKALNRRGKK